MINLLYCSAGAAEGHMMLKNVIEQRLRSLGGFSVGRVLPEARQRMVGPFVFFDHMGPVDFPRGVSRDVDVRPHPHIGLSTVTYLFAGEIMHRDSLDSEQAIRPGEVNWMVAGRGITHSERFEKARAQGDRVHGIQAWVGLPLQDEEAAPAFSHHEGADLPEAKEPGAAIRLIAGEAFGMQARVITHSPIFYAHVTLTDGGRVQLPDQYPERAAFVVSGSAEADGQCFGAGQMLVFAEDQPAIVTSQGATSIMVLGGDPIGERHVEWNFVSSSKERITQAKADWRAGRFKLPDRDNGEFIPLPPDPPPPAPPMS
jgi:redox-sensitive bicupin YhaK (pirin superfamily)